jgi:3-phosphoshikimate 1-carboxyvinyltransferase
LVCALLSEAKTRIQNPLSCDDTEVTLKLSEMMGATIKQGQNLEIKGPSELQAPSSEMDCRGSGTTLRIFTALSALSNGTSILTGDVSLQKRPIAELLSALHQLGIDAKSLRGDGTPPVRVQGKGLTGGVVRIRGNVTSQYISGLLFACSKAIGESRIDITTELESQPYVEMTLEVMNDFGVRASPSDMWKSIAIPGNQNYQSANYEVPGDYSSAANLLVAGALAGRVRVTGLRKNAKQGDAEIINLLKNMGVGLESKSDSFISNHAKLTPLEINASDIPDLVPILAVLATQAEGVTRIHSASRLRFKESDRLATTTKELRKMGATITERKSEVIIKGSTPLFGAVVDSHNDHRIAMAGVVAGLVADGSTEIEDIECVRKSYPRFIEHIQSLGANVEIVGSNNTKGGKI